MIVTLAAALSLATSLAMDVPYLAQTDSLCGGAAAAMVFRYWGDVHADPQEFSEDSIMKIGCCVSDDQDIVAFQAHEVSDCDLRLSDGDRQGQVRRNTGISVDILRQSLSRVIPLFKQGRYVSRIRPNSNQTGHSLDSHV